MLLAEVREAMRRYFFDWGREFLICLYPEANHKIRHNDDRAVIFYETAQKYNQSQHIFLYEESVRDFTMN